MKVRRPKKVRAGFTMVELLTSMAIFGLLAAIFFGGLARARERLEVKYAANQMQVDIQEMQNRAQSGLVLPGEVNRPLGYGVYATTIASGNTKYVLFGNKPPEDSAYGPPDVDVKVTTLPTTVVVHKIFDDSANTATSFSYIYAVPNVDKPTLTVTGGLSFALNTTNITIVLKHTRLNICYNVVISRATGIVNKRQSSSTSQCT